MNQFNNLKKEPSWRREEWLILIRKSGYQPLTFEEKELISKKLRKFLEIKNNFILLDQNIRNINGINWQSNNLLKYKKSKDKTIHKQ